MVLKKLTYDGFAMDMAARRMIELVVRSRTRQQSVILCQYAEQAQADKDCVRWIHGREWVLEGECGTKFTVIQ